MPRFYNLLQTALLRQTWVRPIDFDVLAARGTMPSKVFEHVPSTVMHHRKMHGVCRMTSLTIYLYIYDIYMSYIYQLMLMYHYVFLPTRWRSACHSVFQKLHPVRLYASLPAVAVPLWCVSLLR